MSNGVAIVAISHEVRNVNLVATAASEDERKTLSLLNRIKPFIRMRRHSRQLTTRFPSIFR